MPTCHKCGKEFAKYNIKIKRPILWNEELREKYQILREETMDHDAFICKMCNEFTGEPVIDHIKPIMFKGKFWDANNMQALCKECHKYKTNKEKAFKNWMQEICCPKCYNQEIERMKLL